MPHHPHRRMSVSGHRGGRPSQQTAVARSAVLRTPSSAIYMAPVVELWENRALPGTAVTHRFHRFSVISAPGLRYLLAFIHAGVGSLPPLGQSLLPTHATVQQNLDKGNIVPSISYNRSTSISLKNDIDTPERIQP